MSETLEGRNPVLEALRSGRPLNKILMSKHSGGQTPVSEIIALSRSRGIVVEFVDREILDKLSETRSHQGVIAYVSAKEYVSLDDLIKISRERNEPPLYCVLDGIEDPHNLGAIIRTAEASGFHGIIIRSRREVGITAAVARASAGAVEYVPVARVTNISQTIEALKHQNIWTIGVDTAGKTDYTSPDYKLPTAIVIGGEGKGITELVKKRCDYLASIPMKGKISSLNASIAAAIVMYEALRQRASTSKK
jgi:23S rRNA (guanosine2251-2'-O)-methyltransferase